MQKLRRGVVLMRLDQIDEMMRYRSHGFRAGFRGTDIHVPINLSRIDADDFHWQVPGYFKRGPAFPARSRAHQ
jgi:hypothetical protein